MAVAFVLRWKIDRPCLEADKPGDVYSLLTIEPGTALIGSQPPPSIPSHLILLVDVSGSMDVLVRHDPKAQSLGMGKTEGKKAQRVVSDVPSRREMASAVVQKMVERMHSDDLLTLIAFDDQAYTLTRAARPDALDVIQPAIQQLSKVGGSGTSLGEAFVAIRNVLTGLDDQPRTRKVVLLTDGEDDHPMLALAHAKSVGWDFRLPIVAFGTGECKVSFLTELAKMSLAGAFNHIRDENAAEALFRQAVNAQKNIQATNVQLQLWLSPDLHVRELYRTKPEILFVGDMQPDKQNLVQLRLEQMERGRAYEFLFRCSLPARPSGQRFRIAKATLSYDLPGQNQTGLKQETNIVVEYTSDSSRAAERSGDVRRVLTRAEVQRQLLFLQEKIDLLQRNTGTPRDRVIVAKLLTALIAKFEEFGEQAMVNQYRSMQQEFMRTNTISQEMLNRSLAASSRAEDIIVAQDIDF